MEIQINSKMLRQREGGTETQRQAEILRVEQRERETQEETISGRLIDAEGSKSREKESKSRGV